MQFKPHTIFLALVWLTSAAQAQTMPPGHDMSSAQGHDMSSMMGMTTGEHEMQSAFGPYSMTREGSGTAWQPDATPMMGLHMKQGEWSLMTHGFINAIYDKQTGPRGGDKAFTESMFMLMGNRPVGPGTLGLRAMVSLDPTQGKRGYPLLFETGETANGSTPLVDRQHPHDLFMELSTSYSLKLGSDGAVFGYLGLPGEPALGPPAFMHRFSGMRIPEAPLTHHWLDSTHITFGVATIGASKGPVQLEGSWFNGREPDPYRWNIETRRFDSWSTRLSYNPLPEVSMQVSYGDLRSPEQLEPDVRVKRTTASITYHPKNGGDDWATTLAYGRNKKSGGEVNLSEPGWLLESTYVVADRRPGGLDEGAVAPRSLLRRQPSVLHGVRAKAGCDRLPARVADRQKPPGLRVAGNAMLDVRHKTGLPADICLKGLPVRWLLSSLRSAISMNRYYMTADTREALIAESKRLIAARAGRQAAQFAPPAPERAFESGNDARFAADDGSAASGSAFSRLVSDLRAAASLPPSAWERRRRTGDRRAAP